MEGTRKDIRLDAVAVAGAASAAGKIRLAAGPLYPRRSQRFNKKQMMFDTTIIVKKIVCQEVTIFHHTKYDTSSKIKNLAKVATLFTGRPDRMPKGNRVMGRMGHTGQCCPFCPFLCSLWASCPVALYGHGHMSEPVREGFPPLWLEVGAAIAIRAKREEMDPVGRPRAPCPQSGVQLARGSGNERVMTTTTATRR